MRGNFLWRAEDVVCAVRGRCLHEQSWIASGISIDSRATRPGDLFVALQGSSADGHDYVADAFAAGAAAALIMRQPLQAPPGARLVFVEDTFAALRELGCMGRARAKAKIIAVTGSVGKTSVMEMLRLSLGAVGNVYANSNGWGARGALSSALANLPPDAEYGVFEMGARSGGELSALSRLLRPDIAVITAIEAVNLESFGSVEAIADAHAEIFESMGASGVAILNRDSLHYARLASAAKSCGIRNIRSFSEEAKADAALRECSLTEIGSAVQAVIAGREVSYSLSVPGRHLVKNSLAALLAAFAASGNAEECAVALQRYEQRGGFGVLRKIDLPDGGWFGLIDDSADANPASVRAAMRLLAQTTPAPGGRRILVLGDMPALGATSPDMHIGLVPDIADAKIALVFCCGDMTRYLFDALPEALRGAYAPESAELASLVAGTVDDGDVVIVKGAKNLDMGRVVDALKALDTPPQQKIVSA